MIVAPSVQYIHGGSGLLIKDVGMDQSVGKSLQDAILIAERSE